MADLKVVVVVVLRLYARSFDPWTVVGAHVGHVLRAFHPAARTGFCASLNAAFRGCLDSDFDSGVGRRILDAARSAARGKR
jgi:hypothetical protein